MAGWEFLSSQDVSKLGAAKLASRVLVPNQLSLSVLKIGIHRRDVEDLKAGHQVEHLTKRVKRFEECHSPLAESFDIRRRKKLSTNTTYHPYKVKYEVKSQPVN